MSPVVRWPCIDFPERTNKRSIFDTGRIGRIASGQKRVGMQFGIESTECTRFNQFYRKRIPFGLRAIAPLDGICIAQGSGFHYPCRKAFVENTEDWSGVLTWTRFDTHPSVERERTRPLQVAQLLATLPWWYRLGTSSAELHAPSLNATLVLALCRQAFRR